MDHDRDTGDSIIGKLRGGTLPKRRGVGGYQTSNSGPYIYNFSASKRSKVCPRCHLFNIFIFSSLCMFMYALVLTQAKKKDI